MLRNSNFFFLMWFPPPPHSVMMVLFTIKARNEISFFFMREMFGAGIAFKQAITRDCSNLSSSACFVFKSNLWKMNSRVCSRQFSTILFFFFPPPSQKPTQITAFQEAFRCLLLTALIQASSWTPLRVITGKLD